MARKQDRLGSPDQGSQEGRHRGGAHSALCAVQPVITIVLTELMVCRKHQDGLGRAGVAQSLCREGQEDRSIYWVLSKHQTPW